MNQAKEIQQNASTLTVNRLQERLNALSELNARFLKASNDTEIIAAFLQTALDQANALGTSYIPFDDQGRPQTVIRQGIDAPDIDIQDWEAVLEAPPIRTQCRVCLKQQLISETCPLFSNPIREKHQIFCIRLNRGAEKIGILNLYLPVGQSIGPELETFLQTLADQTALALESLRWQRKYTQLQKNKTGQFAQKPAAEIEQAAILAERKRLGREIHDGLAQILSYVKMQMAQMEDYVQAGQTQKLAQSIRTSHQAISEAFVEAREAIDDLRAATLTEDFTHWVLETAQNFQETFGIPVVVANFPPQLNFSAEIKAQLTRILQEALANIRKHARARLVRISYHQSATDTVITLHDDGVGFNVDEKLQSARHGLKTMPERAALIGAKLNIISEPDQGTLITIQIPN